MTPESSADARIAEVRRLLIKHSSDVALFSGPADIRWLTGFTGSNAFVVISTSDAVLLTDPRYEQQVVREVSVMRAVALSGNLASGISKNIDVPVEADILCDSATLTVAALEQLKSSIRNGVSWQFVAGILRACRATKTADEIGAIRRAQAVTDEVFAQLLEVLRPGLTELEVAAEIVYRHLCLGASGMSFDPIVASGPNGALPHARPGSRQLQDGDLVVIDMGCMLDGYASDMTRTVAIGTPSSSARQAYDAVQRAQAAAIAAARSGIQAAELDAAARNTLVSLGYGKYFVHSLGHGVGLEVHEWPRIGATSVDSLPDSAVVTIEPGVYVPDELGIRIEDLVILRRNGCENLTTSSRDLQIIR